MAEKHATAWRNVAKVVKPQGLKGEVVVVSINGLPFVLQEGMEVVLTPPELKGPRVRRIERVRELSSGYGVTFSACRTLDDAQKLAGKLVLAKRVDVDDRLVEEEFLDVIGLEVVDGVYGSLGSITDVLETAAHDIWVVEGPYGDVLVPAVDEFITSLPESEDDPICMDLPAGLVGLNSATDPSGEEDYD